MYLVLKNRLITVLTEQVNIALAKRAFDPPCSLSLFSASGSPVPRLITSLILKGAAVAGLVGLLISTVWFEKNIGECI
jgi:hypothetical protein